MLLWDDFRLVKAVAERRTLAGAAEALGINTSTVFRRLGALEERLEHKLFERGRIGYALTPCGEEMVDLAARMADDIAAFELRVAGLDLKPSGELRVATNDSFLIHVLTPVFAHFRMAYPDIKLDVVVGNQSLNLSRRDADVAIRATTHPTETLVGRRIASIVWGVYGRADAGGLPGSRDALKGWEWIGYSDSLGITANAEMCELTGRDAGYRLNTVSGLSQAVAAGMGIAPLPCFIGDADPALKRLVEPIGTAKEGVWLLTHADLKGSARVRAFLDFAAGELAALKPLFEGRAATA